MVIWSYVMLSLALGEKALCFYYERKAEYNPSTPLRVTSL